MKTKEIKQAIRDVYAWPGGYELVAITSDGALLCMNCCKENFSSIVDNMKNGHNTGWRIDAITYEAVSPDCAPEETHCNCAQCNKEFGELA